MTACPISEVSHHPLFFLLSLYAPTMCCIHHKMRPLDNPGKSLKLYPPTHGFLEAQKTSTCRTALCLTPFQVPQGLGASATVAAVTCLSTNLHP